MIAQMAIVSMYAVYAKEEFDLDSLHVGFAMSLGAFASVTTNIWISPVVNDKLGDARASVVGSIGVVLGSLAVLSSPIQASLAGLMLAYLGLAINSSAVACGAAGLTDAANRSTVMIGVRMLKSCGAVIGPVIGGWLAGIDHRMPFIAAAGFAAIAAVTQLLLLRSTDRLAALLSGRRSVGLDSALLGGEGWQDEYGTPEEIRDLGECVADLLTKRHYRWVTYNAALKALLSDVFPPLPTVSDEEHREGYDRVRAGARRQCSQAMMLNERC
ncbi:unnamed protein product [Polarella glacialis]|uniref:Major facilitator superfamily (MFS) profile domain-containing protein n=1 Tax=Polarella glacialis TaxID=89957 RepID=A0A813G692_POLGL|nr:unnamed protein product [Polarella glacialis]